jgi:isopentenyl-diphosphate delta-isomerase
LFEETEHMTTPIQSRKADHLALCAEGDVGFREQGTLLGGVRLVHDALPDLAESDVDLGASIFGKKLRAPILIAAMTGGTDEAGRINRQLAAIAEARGYAFGLGSQRAMAVRPETRDSYRVRDVAKSALLFGNVGVVQARAMKTREVQALVDDVGADALCVHLNPAMELVQPGGDRDFRGGLETIARLCAELSVPVVVKETGCGIAPRVARRVLDAGARGIDVSGAGGTSWVGVETLRAEAQGDARARSLGEAFWDWGVPTAVSVASVSKLAAPKKALVVATGGVATGLDAARAIALGAGLVGIARPVLKALRAGGPDEATALLDSVERELRAAMLLTGSRDLGALQKAPRVLSGELLGWLAQIEDESGT